MNCAHHPDVPVSAYCQFCGKPLCKDCVRSIGGVIYCEQCLAARVQTPGGVPVSVPAGTIPLPPANANPLLAGLLGFIPGVGAMYNGQFMKGFLHVMAFVCLIWMADQFGPIMVPVFFAYFFYLVFDAYKTAHALELGQPVPDPFGFERMFGPTPRPHYAAAAVPPVPGTATPLGAGTARFVPVQGTSAPVSDAPPQPRSGVPTGAIILIGLGVLFFLNTIGFLEFGLHRFWPLILVAFGGWIFAKRWGLVGSQEGYCPCERCKACHIMWPAVIVTFGILVLIHNLGGPSFFRTWPLLILVVGAVKLFQSNASDEGHIGGPPVPPPQPQPPAMVMSSSEPQDQAQPPSEVNHG
jgi:hypothetical protein